MASSARRHILSISSLLLCVAVSACSGKIPGVYRVPVQQGNVITVEMLQELELGMDKRKVRFILGTPLVTDAFHQDRWDYFYSYQQGFEDRVQQRASLFFDGDRLVRIDADIDSQIDFHTVTDAKENVLIMPKKKKGGFLAALTPAFVEREEAEARETEISRSLDSGFNKRQPGSGTTRDAAEPVDPVREPARAAAPVVGPGLGAAGTPSELYAPNTTAEIDTAGTWSTEPPASVEVISAQTQSQSRYLEALFENFGSTPTPPAPAGASESTAAPEASTSTGFSPQPTRD